ncbi:hypothetical protein FHR33_003587 [Nonomuraea dietziae]|uniref:Uncharacterized protein n=1 Tax=Nonomuraea dietziae TaxID=65515 RepID=A0A7W5VH61_9ACTN|nr:hypothetical protein [Nonomuraea dietziae]
MQGESEPQDDEPVERDRPQREWTHISGGHARQVKPHLRQDREAGGTPDGTARRGEQTNSTREPRKASRSRSSTNPCSRTGHTASGPTSRTAAQDRSRRAQRASPGGGWEPPEGAPVERGGATKSRERAIQTGWAPQGTWSRSRESAPCRPDGRRRARGAAGTRAHNPTGARGEWSRGVGRAGLRVNGGCLGRDRTAPSEERPAETSHGEEPQPRSRRTQDAPGHTPGRDPTLTRRTPPWASPGQAWPVPPRSHP